MKAVVCNHRRYVPMLVDLVRSGTIDPQQVLTQREPVMNALDAYKAFDQRQPGWIKVELLPAANAGRASA
jgi:threonine dehydrogenase-like Zn-dependent dehydrogenase